VDFDWLKQTLNLILIRTNVISLNFIEPNGSTVNTALVNPVKIFKIVLVCFRNQYISYQ